MLGQPRLGAALLVWALASRILLCVVGRRIHSCRPGRLQVLLALSVANAMGSILWVASYVSRTVGWRDDKFVLQKDGLMRRI